MFWGERAGVLLSEAFYRYIQDRIVFANKSPKTEESYLNTQKSFIKHIGDMELSDLTFQHIRKWADIMRKKGLVSGTIRGHVVNIRAVLSYMRMIGNECINPELIPVPKRIDPTPDFLQPEDVTRLISIIDTTNNCNEICKARNKAIIALLYSSLIRASELCSLNREDVCGNVFTVLGKGGKRRPCMIDERARKLLDNYLSLRTDNQPALFIDNMTCTRMTTGTLQSQFRRLSKRFGKPVHAHTLRHSGANNLMRNGCHIYPLSRIMGHTSIATTQTYFQMYDPELVEVYQRYHTI